MKYLKVDGYIGESGIKNVYGGGFVTIDSLIDDNAYIQRFKLWLNQYEIEHYNSFANIDKVEQLDVEGIALTKILREKLPNDKISYYSHAKNKLLLV
jgi:hypothetical protein